MLQKSDKLAANSFQSPEGFFGFFATQVAMRVVDVNQGGPRSKMGR